MSSNINITIDESVLKTYMVTTSILVAKMLLMSPLTSRQRLLKKIFANPEDAKYFPPNKDGKVILDDPDVERVRRAHRNDLENLTPYWIISTLYMMSNPSPNIAMLCMVLHLVSRMCHTYVYAVDPKPQPARVICWTVGYGITAFMTFSVFAKFIK